MAEVESANAKVREHTPAELEDDEALTCRAVFAAFTIFQ
jgi:hypothetical protein